jgi:hypothetical protein
MIMKSDASLKHVEDFTAQIQTLDIPGELKVGYSPIGFVRCGRSACRVTKIDWKARASRLLVRALLLGMAGCVRCACAAHAFCSAQAEWCGQVSAPAPAPMPFAWHRQDAFLHCRSVCHS